MYLEREFYCPNSPETHGLQSRRKGIKNKFIMLLEKKDGVKLMVRQPNGQHKKEIGYWL